MTKTMWTDVDEVLCNFQEGVFEIVEQLYGRKMSADQLDGWDLFGTFTDDERRAVLAECERPGFCARLEPIRGAKEAVGELRKHVQLYAVTSHFHSHTWVSERDWWLTRHFGFKKSEIIHTSAKFLVKTDIGIDDKPENIVNWKKNHPSGLAMLWPIPNTRNVKGLEDYRVKDWDEVLRKVVDHKVVG